VWSERSPRGLLFQ